MEFVAAVKGAYDAYTEQFMYRWHDGDGHLQSYSVFAPCHTSSPPLMAYTCFSGLISSEAKLQDVLDSDEESTGADEEGVPFLSIAVGSDTAAGSFAGV